MSSNVAVYSIRKINSIIKNAVEERFDYIQVRGEIGRINKSSTGHYFFTLSEETERLNAVIWKQVYASLDIKPEDGLEVIIEGKITVYNSSYQLVVESLRPEGIGALLKLIEARKKKLDEEGLFDSARKKSWTKYPQHIAVITSPEGAVLQDIIHRLNERFPLHLTLIPCTVQGANAASNIQESIEVVNKYSETSYLEKVDLIIIARGGGSFEDLMPFNEENVVRAVSASKIPIISAVGHETDHTLIDLVSDKRAPTPTAAVEFAVPHKKDLLENIHNYNKRTFSIYNSVISQQTSKLKNLEQSLAGVSKQIVQRHSIRLSRLQIPSLNEVMNLKRQKQLSLKQNLQSNVKQQLRNIQHQYKVSSKQLQSIPLRQTLQQKSETITNISKHLDNYCHNKLAKLRDKFKGQVSLLESLSYTNVLKRGFAIVRKQKDNSIIRSPEDVRTGERLSILLAKGKLEVVKQTDKNTKDDSQSSGDIQELL